MTSDLGSLKIDPSLKDTHRNRRPRWPWVLAIIALIALLGFFARGGGRPITVQTVRAESATVGADGVVLNATGYIIAAHKIELAPKVVGRVSWVGVERGDRVEPGQILVKLEDDEYRARALQAQGQLDAAKARLDELQNGSRPEEIAQAKAQLEVAQAEMAAAAARVQRTRMAAESKALSAIELEEAEFRHKAQQARVAALQQAYELVRKGPRAEQIAAQKALADQATGLLQLAQVDLSNTIIKAPVKGTILERNVEVGEYVTTGFVGERGAKGYVVSLADLNDLRVELDISQDDFAKVALDQRCQVTTDAYPDRKYAGAVDLIAPEANRQKATVQVRVKIVAPDELLRPDMNASVAFLSRGSPASAPGAATAAAGAVVPLSAVRDDAVFIVVDGRAVRKMVELGSPTARGVLVKKGLAEGEQVIVSPPENLTDGASVKQEQP